MKKLFMQMVMSMTTFCFFFILTFIAMISC
jgi:hypothetical protein